MKFFPILSKWQWGRGIDNDLVGKVPLEIPFELVKDHEKQAMINHCDQNLEKLASRGGLSPAELYCVINDLGFYKIPSDDVQITEKGAVEWLLRLIA